MHVLGSFIFGLPTDKPSTFDATVELAMKAGVTFAQFVMMTPFPGDGGLQGLGEDAGGKPNPGRGYADYALLADSDRDPAEDVYARIR